MERKNPKKDNSGKEQSKKDHHEKEKSETGQIRKGII